MQLGNNPRGVGRLVFAVGLVVVAWVFVGTTDGFVDVVYSGPPPERPSPSLVITECADEAKHFQWGAGTAALDRCMAAREDAFHSSVVEWQASAVHRWDVPYMIVWSLLLVVALAACLGAGRIAAWVARGFASSAPA